MHKKKGQSILEYVIILTVIVAAIIVAASTFIAPTVNQTMNAAAASINRAVGVGQLP